MWMTANVVSLEAVRVTWGKDAQPFIVWIQSEVKRTLSAREGNHAAIIRKPYATNPP
jgi:hypothetical protein